MTPDELRQRRRVLLTMLVALGFRYPPAVEPPVITGIRKLLHGWVGVGRMAVGMARQGYDLQLTRYGSTGWRANFFPAGLAHSITSALGSGWGYHPWRAVQQAGLQALTKREAEEER